MEFEHLEFEVEKMTGDGDAQTLARAIGAVDPDAKVDVDLNARAVKVDSWLMAEEFLVAFEDAGYQAKISKDELAREIEAQHVALISQGHELLQDLEAATMRVKTSQLAGCLIEPGQWNVVLHEQRRGRGTENGDTR
ncbi:heavy-metal-associated domain-containing protein [Paraburkholderia strydomiana]|uniref:heavy-metal-associated domain-containing protein n=1 Tax=Paraburkholderia strydomiana TaxID=1245417 RepID=UPI0038B71114